MRPAGLNDSSLTDPPPSTRLRLEIQYPYPGIHPDFVHATLRVIPAGSNGSIDLGVRDAPPAGLRGFSNANSRGGGLLSPTVGPPVNRGPKPGEEWLVIDLPKTELSALFVDLANDGFFQRPSVKGGESHLQVMYNQGQVDKVWTPRAAPRAARRPFETPRNSDARPTAKRSASRVLHGTERKELNELQGDRVQIRTAGRGRWLPCGSPP